MTQEELGERTDLSKGYISQIERDLSSPSIDTFFSILEVLGCSPKEFFDDIENVKKLSMMMKIKQSLLMKNKATKFSGLYQNRMRMIWNRLFYTLEPNGKFKEFEPSLVRNLCLCFKRTSSRRTWEKELYHANAGEAYLFSCI